MNRQSSGQTDLAHKHGEHFVLDASKIQMDQLRRLVIADNVNSSGQFLPWWKEDLERTLSEMMKNIKET
jgi:hypothetical protein